jgi:hypothetical protein
LAYHALLQDLRAINSVLPGCCDLLTTVEIDAYLAIHSAYPAYSAYSVNNTTEDWEPNHDRTT